MRLFLFVFLLFPFIELAVLIQVGSAIGVLPTLLLVIGSGVLGVLLLRVAGVATAWRARERLAKGELPEQEMLEGLLIAVGGALLLLPGFVSDLVGLLCLLPVTRRLMVRRLRQRAADQAVRQRAFAEDLAARQGVRPDGSRLDVIEGEYRRHDPRDPKGQ